MIRSHVTATNLVVLIASVVAGLLVAAVVSSDEDAAAQESIDSYQLIGLSFSYPYADPATGSTDSRLAGISYVPAWAGLSYPGKTACSVVLYGGSMNEVGRLDFGLSAPEPNGERITEVPVIVSEGPQSTSWSCSDPYYPPGAGYEFTLREVIPTTSISGVSVEGSATLIFQSSWIGDQHPGMRACDLMVDVAGETRTFGPYNVSIAQQDFDDLDFEVPIPRIQQIDSASLECSEL